MISVTITDRSGRTLSGQTLDAFYASVRHARPFSVGLNCALGASEMRPYLAELARIAECYVTCYPNAGLPNAFGQYDELPQDTARLLRDFAESGFVNILGGCCGTTPDHIRAIGDGGRRTLPPGRIGIRDRPSAPDPARIPIPTFTAVRRSRDADHPPRQQLHHDRRADQRHRVEAIRAARHERPVRRGRQRRARPGARRRQHPRRQHGRGDARLRGGDDHVPQPHRHRARDRAAADHDRQLEVVRPRGWPEVRPGEVDRQLDQPEGRAKRISSTRRASCGATARASSSWRSTSAGRPTPSRRKVEICQRAYRLLVDQAGFDPGRHHLRPEHPRHRHRPRGAQRVRDQLHRGDARHQGEPARASTSAAASATCRSRSAATTSVREAIHSAFLFHAIKAGLDMGIVNAGQLVVYEDIPKDLLEHVEDVIFNRRPDATERLVQFADTVKGAGTKRELDLVVARGSRRASGWPTRSSTASSISSSRTSRRRARRCRVRSTSSKGR